MAGCVTAQVTYVNSKNDIRYIKYTDSLVAWCRAEYIKSEHRRILDSRVETLGDYCRLIDSLGYGLAFDRVVRKENKEYAETKGAVETQQIELLWKGVFGTDIVKKVYTIKIKRPDPVYITKKIKRPDPIQFKVMNGNNNDEVKIKTTYIDTNKKVKTLSILWFHGDKLDSTKIYAIHPIKY